MTVINFCLRVSRVVSVELLMSSQLRPGCWRPESRTALPPALSLRQPSAPAISPQLENCAGRSACDRKTVLVKGPVMQGRAVGVSAGSPRGRRSTFCKAGLRKRSRRASSVCAAGSSRLQGPNCLGPRGF